MRISHKHKFVFLSLPRAASLSIRKFLEPYSDIKSKRIDKTDDDFPFWHHIKAEDTKKIFEDRGWCWKRYDKFCMVRNPYERMISAYKMRWEKMYGWYSTGNDFRDVKSFLRDILFEPITFEEFVKESSVERGFTISALNFVSDGNGKILVDDILKFENIPENVNEYANKVLGLDTNREGLGHHHNSGRKKSSKNWYNKKTKKLVEERYNW